MEPQKITLASSSVYRKAILDRIGLKFDTQSPNIDESIQPAENADSLVRRLAMEKAKAVSTQFPSALVIGSDQVGEIEGSIIGKPKDRADAIDQLSTCSGRTLVLHTGIALLNAQSGNLQVDVDLFRVTYHKLSDEIIHRYLDKAEPYDSCGSLKAEGVGISLLKSLSGDDPNTLMGLPLIKLIGMLRNEGIDLI